MPDIDEVSKLREYFVATTTVISLIDMDAERVAAILYEIVLQGVDERKLQKIGTYRFSDLIEVDRLLTTRTCNSTLDER
jgi:hypothetical protein